MTKFNERTKKQILTEYNDRKPIKEIISRYGVAKSTIFNWIKKGFRTKKFIEYKKYEILQKELEHTKLKLEIYENLHCFKDASIHDKEVAIAKHLGQYPIKTMCKILDLPTGTFYNYHFRKKKITQYQIKDEELKTEITKVYLKSEKRFGAKKIFAKLQSNGFRTSLKKIQKLMNELNIKSIQKPQKNETRKPDTDYQFNKLKRLFNQDAPNKFWVSDITEVKVRLTKFYLCVIIDLFSRKVIAYRLSSQNNTNLTINTFKDAFENRNRPAELSFHTDQGTNYTSTAFRDLLQILKVNQSFSHRGNPYDNACMESFYASFKREEYNAKEYEFFEDLENSVDSYMEFYNNYRPHESLKNKTPNQFEAEFYENLAIKKSQISQ